MSTNKNFDKDCSSCVFIALDNCSSLSCVDRNKWKQKKEEIKEEVNHPTHYMRKGIEAIDIIEAFDLGFCEGNAVKYILRAGKKSPDKKTDIQKAIWYLQRILKEEKK